MRRRSVSDVRTQGRLGNQKPRVETWFQAGQAFAALAAVLLAVPGVIFAIRAYEAQQKLNRDQQILNRDQQALNQDQLVLNGIALERNERRYASRVSFWDVGTYEDKPDERRHETLVKIRNMTPLPITNVVLIGAPGIRGSLPSPRPRNDDQAVHQPLVQVETIAPCHETEVWVHRGDLHQAWLRMLRPHVQEIDIKDVPMWVTAGMDFVVAGKKWKATNHSLEPAPKGHDDGFRSVADLAAARIGKEAAGATSLISNCGEGD